jgi:hypothetical protein
MYNSISDAATECPDLRFVWAIRLNVSQSTY